MLSPVYISASGYLQACKTTEPDGYKRIKDRKIISQRKINLYRTGIPAGPA